MVSVPPDLNTDGVLDFDQGRVDFSPIRQVVPGPAPNPFPPEVAEPGSIGDPFYTPLVKLVNAGGPHLQPADRCDGTGRGIYCSQTAVPNYDAVHDSVLAIDFENETVTLGLAAGFSFGRPVLYLSTDSNSGPAAALEGATLAPGLDDIDVGNDDSLFSAVERIFITTNGPRGCNNPQRQGLVSALTDGEAPFNVLGGIPTIAHQITARCGTPTSPSGLRKRSTMATVRGLIDEFQILSFVEFGFLVGPAGNEYGSSGIIINCPIVHRFL